MTKSEIETELKNSATYIKNARVIEFKADSLYSLEQSIAEFEPISKGYRLIKLRTRNKSAYLNNLERG